MPKDLISVEAWTIKSGYGVSVQTGYVYMKRRPGNGIEGAMVCTSLDSLLRPLFYFLDDVSYPQSVYICYCSWNFLKALLVKSESSHPYDSHGRFSDAVQRNGMWDA